MLMLDDACRVGLGAGLRETTATASVLLSKHGKASALEKSHSKVGWKANKDIGGRGNIQNLEF